ncbi:hypothetical protein [Singulisphaera sp. PoT]
MEAYQIKLAELDKMFKGGLIDQDTLTRGQKQAKAEFEKKSNPDNRYAAAMEMGSAEARTTLLNYRGVDSQSDPQKDVAKTNREQVVLQSKMLEALNKLLQQGASAVTGAVADSALAVFDFQ